MSLLETLKKSTVPGVLYDGDVVHELLPQKAPFAFVDEVISLSVEGAEPDMAAVCHLTGKEFFFEGHFPGNPIMPGVLQVEAMAQVATLLTKIAKEKDVVEKRPAFMGIEKCRFKNPVVPPADLIIAVKMIAARSNIFKYVGTVRVGETLVCEAEFAAAMI